MLSREAQATSQLLPGLYNRLYKESKIDAVGYSIMGARPFSLWVASQDLPRGVLKVSEFIITLVI